MPRVRTRTHHTNPEAVQSVSLASQQAWQARKAQLSVNATSRLGSNDRGQKCDSAQRSSPLTGEETSHIVTLAAWMVIPAEAEDPVFLTRPRSLQAHPPL